MSRHDGPLSLLLEQLFPEPLHVGLQLQRVLRQEMLAHHAAVQDESQAAEQAGVPVPRDVGVAVPAPVVRHLPPGKIFSTPLIRTCGIDGRSGRNFC